MMRKTKLFPAFILGASICSAALVSCNNNGDDKTTKTDSTVVKTDSSTMKMAPKDTMMKKDTVKMDTMIPPKKPVNNP